LQRFLIAACRQVPHSHFDGARTPPEELVNFASAMPDGRFKRSQINQPDLTFPPVAWVYPESDRTLTKSPLLSLLSLLQSLRQLLQRGGDLWRSLLWILKSVLLRCFGMYHDDFPLSL
jgi:hypothetical protein